MEQVSQYSSVCVCVCSSEYRTSCCVVREVLVCDNTITSYTEISLIEERGERRERVID